MNALQFCRHKRNVNHATGRTARWRNKFAAQCISSARVTKSAQLNSGHAVRDCTSCWRSILRSEHPAASYAKGSTIAKSRRIRFNVHGIASAIFLPYGQIDFDCPWNASRPRVCCQQLYDLRAGWLLVNLAGPRSSGSRRDTEKILKSHSNQRHAKHSPFHPAIGRLEKDRD